MAQPLSAEEEADLAAVPVIVGPTGPKPKLASGKTVINLFADFMRYLFNCAEKFICDTHPTVARSWADLKSSGAITFVIAHPNGWEGLQQSKMRQAAVMAGLVPDNSSGHARVHFVNEGEASLHFCIQSDQISSSIEACGALRRSGMILTI